MQVQGQDTEPANELVISFLIHRLHSRLAAGSVCGPCHTPQECPAITLLGLTANKDFLSNRCMVISACRLVTGLSSMLFAEHNPDKAQLVEGN